MKFVCFECTDEEIPFDSAKELSEHRKSGHILMPPEPPPPPPPPPEPEPVKEEIKVEPKQIVLRYLYEGECTQCNRTVDTIEIPVGEESMVVAYCPPCRMQIAQATVMPIHKQLAAIQVEPKQEKKK